MYSVLRTEHVEMQKKWVLKPYKGHFSEYVSGDVFSLHLLFFVLTKGYQVRMAILAWVIIWQPLLYLWDCSSTDLAWNSQA